MRVPALSGSSHQSAHFDILRTNATKQKDAILRRVRLALQPMKPAMPCFAETCSFEFQAFAATCFENSTVMYNHNMYVYIYIYYYYIYIIIIIYILLLLVSVLALVLLLLVVLVLVLVLLLYIIIIYIINKWTEEFNTQPARVTDASAPPAKTRSH